MPYETFISYSRRDNAQGRITALVERIQLDFASFEGMLGRELHVFFDQEEIHGMSDWRQRILQGLRESPSSDTSSLCSDRNRTQSSSVSSKPCNNHHTWEGLHC